MIVVTQKLAGSFVLCSLHSPVTFVFKGLDVSLKIRRHRPALTFIEQYLQDKCLVEFNLWKKLMALFFHGNDSLVMAQCVLVLV